MCGYRARSLVTLAVCYFVVAAVPCPASDAVPPAETSVAAETADTDLTAELDSLQRALTEAAVAAGSRQEGSAPTNAGEAFRLKRRQALLEKMEQRKQAVTQPAMAMPRSTPPDEARVAVVRAASPPHSSTSGAPSSALLPSKSPAMSSLEVTFDKRGGTSQDSPASGASWASRVAGLTATGETSILARVEGRDQAGTPVNVEPEWSAIDPTRVTVSPNRGSLVRLSIHAPGASNLIVRSGDITRSVLVSAGRGNQGELVVDILQ
jgi:hypothetical protein